MKKKNYILTAIVFICCFCINNMVAFAGTKFYWPVSTQWKVGTGYYGYTNHNGIDIPASKGTPVYALHDGKAIFYQAYKTNSNGTAYLTSYGNYICVTSHDGTYETLYAHLNAFEGYSLRIPSSQTKRESGSKDPFVIGTRDVKKGELIGYVGTTGNSTGNHLHFGLKINGAYVNPETYLDASCCVKDVNPQTPSNTPQKDTEAPKISNIIISDITEDGYTVTVTVTDNISLDNVKMVVWSLWNDQDDIKWSEAIKNGNTYTYRVKRSDHNNEFGYYATHIYAYDTQGNCSAMAANNVNIVEKDTEAPKISSVTISNITEDGYTVTVTVTDNTGVDNVQIAVWTVKGDQDDIKWSKATKNGNTYTYRVKRSDHNNEFGYYATHIYAYDLQGNYSAAHANDVNIQSQFVDVTSYFAGKEIQIKSVENGKFLSADANYSGIPLLFNCNNASTWETFVTTLTSDKWLGLKSYTNQKWVSAMNNITDSPLQASAATSLQSWECFRIYMKDGQFYIKSQNEKWLCARVDKTSTPAEACVNTASTWERLEIYIKENGKFVSAANIITK